MPSRQRAPYAGFWIISGEIPEPVSNASSQECTIEVLPRKSIISQIAFWRTGHRNPLGLRGWRTCESFAPSTNQPAAEKQSRCRRFPPRRSPVSSRRFTGLLMASPRPSMLSLPLASPRKAAAYRHVYGKSMGCKYPGGSRNNGVGIFSDRRICNLPSAPTVKVMAVLSVAPN